MASVQAQQQRDRMIRAYVAMEKMGCNRRKVTPILNNLLKVYNNAWDFIEAENYRLLADNYFDADDAALSLRDGPVTRAARRNSGTDSSGGSSDGSPSPPRRGSSPAVENPPPPPPPPPPRAMAASHGGLRTSSRSSAADHQREPNSALPVHVAHAVNYHSAASVRTRAASQNGPLSLGVSQGGARGGRPPNSTAAAATHSSSPLSQGGNPGTRGRAQSSGAAAAPSPQEKDKGKSPLVSESRRPLQTASRGARGGPQDHVTVKLEVSSSSPAPEGIEKVAFEKVDGVIRPQNAAVSLPRQIQHPPPPPPLTYRVKIEDDGNPDVQDSPRRSEILSPTPLLAKDPHSSLGVPVIAEPQEATVSRPDHSRRDGVRLDRNEQLEIPSEMATERSTADLQMVPYGTVFNDSPALEQLSNGGGIEPFLDPALVVVLGEQGCDMVNRDGNAVSLVDYEDSDPVEPADPGSPGAGCEVVIIPDESSEQVDPLELNDEEIRPNFIISGSKRDMLDALAAGHPKRLKCEAEAATSSAPARRRLILPQNPLPLVNDDNDCIMLEGPVRAPSSTPGVKRKLIISASPSPERSAVTKEVGTSNGGHTIVRNGAKDKAHQCHDRVKVVPEARGQGSNSSSALKRVKLEPGVEDPNVLQRKHDPNDISRGTERVPIPFVNEFTSETINRKFNYIPSNVVYQNAYINISLARIGDEDFCLDCVGDCLKAPHSCPCTRETGGEFAYTQDGRLKQALIQYEVDTNNDVDLKQKNMIYCASAWDCPIERVKIDRWDCPTDRAKNDRSEPEKCKGHIARKFVKECWHKCGCSMKCGNRVVQRGICRKLEVFFTNDGKGWGIRTAEDLPAGAFVCEYVGEIMTNMELDQRNHETKKIDASRQPGKLKDTYPVNLDGDWCSESGLKDEEALCLDATRYGNVARFINHRCFDANLIDMPVSIETLDRHYYHVAFFTSRYVQAGEELTWDYKIDFEDDEHPIEAFQCLCKSEFCRDPVTQKYKK